MTETRYFQSPGLTARADGTLAGTVLRYGDVAVVPVAGGLIRETILPGAFGNLAEADVTLDRMHRRELVLGRTGGGGLELEDGKEALTMRAAPAQTRDWQDTLRLVRNGTLRGLSVLMDIKDDVLDVRARERRITSAKLHGIGIVDVPAYSDSTLEQRWAEALAEYPVETRQAQVLEAVYKYGQLETISDTGRRRKRRVNTGSFAASIADPEQEITLSVGRNPNAAIASKLAGTLILRDKDTGLEIEAQRVPDTSEFRDLEAKHQAGMEIHVEPLFRELDGHYTDLPEPGNPSVTIREYSGAKLYGLALSVRQPKGSESTVEMRSKKWQQYLL